MHMQRRGAVYSWRRRVPLTLAGKWGRREVVRSLGTTNRDETARLARTLSITADRLFDHAMSHPELTPDQIDTLAREWLTLSLDADEEQRIAAPTRASSSPLPNGWSCSRTWTSGWTCRTYCAARALPTLTESRGIPKGAEI